MPASVLLPIQETYHPQPENIQLKYSDVPENEKHWKYNGTAWQQKDLSPKGR